MRINKLFIIVIVLVLASCGSNKIYDSSDNYTNSEMAWDEAVQEEYKQDGLNLEDIEESAKFEKEGHINNRSTDFDKTLKEVEILVSNYKGYFEETRYQYYGTKSFDGTIKVPVEDFQNLFIELKKCGFNIYNDSAVINVTEGYYSLKSQLEVKKIAKERILDLIDSTKEPEEILDLYIAYYDLITSIEYMEKTLDNMDYTTSYSTIYFSLAEDTGLHVVKVPSEGFFKKIAIGINKSFTVTFDIIGNIILFLAYISVPLVSLSAVGFIIFIIVKKYLRKKD